MTNRRLHTHLPNKQHPLDVDRTIVAVAEREHETTRDAISVGQLVLDKRLARQQCDDGGSKVEDR